MHQTRGKTIIGMALHAIIYYFTKLITNIVVHMITTYNLIVIMNVNILTLNTNIYTLNSK